MNRGDLLLLVGAAMTPSRPERPASRRGCFASACSRLRHRAALSNISVRIVRHGRFIGFQMAGALAARNCSNRYPPLSSSLSDWSLADRGMERRFALREPATGC
jgi:hypothetical protein